MNSRDKAPYVELQKIQTISIEQNMSQLEDTNMISKTNFN